jgi:hypothetical protein
MQSAVKSNSFFVVRLKKKISNATFFGIVFCVALGLVGCRTNLEPGKDKSNATSTSIAQLKELAGDGKFLFVGSDKSNHYFQLEKGYYKIPRASYKFSVRTEQQIDYHGLSVDQNNKRFVCFRGDLIVHWSPKIDDQKDVRPPSL